MEPWMSRMEDAEICESGSSPESMPCISEHGASEQERKETSESEKEEDCQFKIWGIKIFFYQKGKKCK